MLYIYKRNYYKILPINNIVQFILQVWGAKEYLTPGSSLSEYDYIRECVRLEKDVRLVLCEGKDTSMARTERDDARDAHLTLDDLIPSQGATPMLSFDNLSILLGELCLRFYKQTNKQTRLWYTFFNYFSA